MAEGKRENFKQELNGKMVERIRPKIHLSDLHTDILSRIISLLPLKEAARTSVLSNHWKNIWCSQENLVFRFCSVFSVHDHIKRCWTSDGQRLNKELFIERIDAVLKQRSGLGVQTTAVFFDLENEHADHIDRWLNFALASKTKQLILDFKPHCPKQALYNFPFELFSAANSLQLQALKLNTVSLKPPPNLDGFRKLQKLKLEYTNVSDEDMQTLVSNCNSLEYLGIIHCGMITRLETSHPLNQLKHLEVQSCTMLQDIQLNVGLTKLEYEGPLIPLAPPEPLLMTNIWMRLSDIHSALRYIFTKLPSTLPRLETLTVNCSELKKTILPEKTAKFMYLKHLRLELTFYEQTRKADMFDFACLLEAAPLLETLELHMWMPFDHQPYCEDHGELRSLPNRPHSNLRFAYITGFYGAKDQLELVCHILRNSAILNAMKIDPRPVVARPPIALMLRTEVVYCLNGYRVAMEYLSKADHRNVVDVHEILLEDVKKREIYEIMEDRWIQEPKAMLSYF
uniref:F-box domain-containing protein n=1 Tax=Oryza glumipatula TaxID=40148 RepID=A0A0E0AG05_9ORYZ